jgi:hypothetical protein
MNFYPNPYIITSRETFLASNTLQSPAKNPLFEVISLRGPTVPPNNKNFLDSHISVYTESFQRTDISMKPLGPTNYTGSNTTTSKCKVV